MRTAHRVTGKLAERTCRGVPDFIWVTGFGQAALRPECCPRSQSVASGKSGGQRGEITRRHYMRAFVVAESQQPALVACDQIIGLARFGQGQKKIVRGIGRAPHARQEIDVLREFLPPPPTCAAQVRNVNFPSSHASMIAAGLPAGAMRADTMMLVSRTTRIRLC